MSNTTGKGGRLLPAQRQAKKEIFLVHYASCHNAKKACRAAGINKNTFQIWLRNGTLSEDDMRYALGNYQDEIRDRFNVIDGYDPFGTPSKRQLRILAYRYLPEMRATKYGEIRVNVVWWTTSEVAELHRLINCNNQNAEDRKYLYKLQQQEEE